jgi:hypothetical protein
MCIVTCMSDYRRVLDYSLQFSLRYTLVFTVASSLAVARQRRHGGRSPFFGFPNYPRPQLPVPHSISSQRLTLTNPSLTAMHITSRHARHRKHCSYVVVYRPLSNCLFRGRCLTTGLHAIYTVYSIIWPTKLEFSQFRQCRVVRLGAGSELWSAVILCVL